MDHDGLLDRDAEGNLIIQNFSQAYMPDWAYELNQNGDWWFANFELINSEGKKLVGANPDGTYILEGGETGGNDNYGYEVAANEHVGRANGNNGPMTVKVTMDGSTITKIEVLEHRETAGIADPALNTIPNAIVTANSADVDTVAGATNSSNGIINAVKDALK